MPWGPIILALVVYIVIHAWYDMISRDHREKGE